MADKYNNIVFENDDLKITVIANRVSIIDRVNDFSKVFTSMHPTARDAQRALKLIEDVYSFK